MTELELQTDLFVRYIRFQRYYEKTPRETLGYLSDVPHPLFSTDEWATLIALGKLASKEQELDENPF